MVGRRVEGEQSPEIEVGGGLLLAKESSVNERGRRVLAVIAVLFLLAATAQNVAAVKPMPSFDAVRVNGEIGEVYKKVAEGMSIWMARLPSGPSDRGAGH
ncbi:hypothetical protein KSP40_PGU018932 [Platanthera guangdongensis]|uniref:Uncharacterized protein n=1 Tax=Platanthera guangdongensis TaxID=2320717 RepID=A0ABR2LGR0_9ASPA